MRDRTTKILEEAYEQVHQAQPQQIQSALLQKFQDANDPQYEQYKKNIRAWAFLTPEGQQYVQAMSSRRRGDLLNFLSIENTFIDLNGYTKQFTRRLQSGQLGQANTFTRDFGIRDAVSRLIGTQVPGQQVYQ